MDITLEQKINKLKENPKVKDALDSFERAQKTYEQAMNSITLKQVPKYKGSYTSSISKKEYYANISTNTR